MSTPTYTANEAADLLSAFNLLLPNSGKEMRTIKETIRIVVRNEMSGKYGILVEHYPKLLKNLYYLNRRKSYGMLDCIRDYDIHNLISVASVRASYVDRKNREIIDNLAKSGESCNADDTLTTPTPTPIPTNTVSMSTNVSRKIPNTRKQNNVPQRTTTPKTYDDGQLHHSERLFCNRIPESVIIPRSSQ